MQPEKAKGEICGSENGHQKMKASASLAPRRAPAVASATLVQSMAVSEGARRFAEGVDEASRVKEGGWSR